MTSKFRMTDRIGVGLVCACLMVGFLSTAGLAANKQVTIVASMLARGSFANYVEAGFDMGIEEAKQNGYDIKLVITDSEFKLIKQAADVRDMIVSKPDLMILWPCDSRGIVPVIEDINTAGIPVVTIDIAAIGGGDVLSHIASDNYMGGALAADLIAEQMGEKGEVAIIDYPIIASMIDRVRGFKETMAKYPEIKIVAQLDGKLSRQDAFSATQSILLQHPDVKGIFGNCDEHALGALAAVEAAGRDNDMVIVGYDGTPEAIDAIKRGTALKGDAIQYGEKIGQTAIETAVSILEGEKVPQSIAVPMGLVTKADL